MVQYVNKPVNSICPVCQSLDINNLYTVSSSQAAQHFVRKEQNHERFMYLVNHIENLWGDDKCNVNQCNECSFCFSDPYVAGDFDFYRVAHPRHGYPKWKWENQQTIDVISQDCKGQDTVNIKLLEIGAGNGAFIKRALNYISPKNITCTEYSEYGVNSLRSLGVECISQDIRESEMDYSNYFDYVCMFQVLEHLGDLDVLFKKIDNITKKDAKIFIAVPNEKFIEFIETHDALLDMPPNHIGRWNATAFNIISKKYGWSVVDHKYEPNIRLFEMARRFWEFRFLYESQKQGTFANHIYGIDNRYVRYGLIKIFSVFYGLLSPKSLLASISKDNGMAQWVCITKN